MIYFKYIRNYQPFNMDALFNFYRYKMLAYKEWLSLYRDGKLNDIQSQFFEPKRPEALYNIDQDPHEVNDLSKSEDYKEILLQMREKLRERTLEMPDLSFYPEPYLLDNALENPTAFAIACDLAPITFIVINFFAPSPSTTICFARFKHNFFKLNSNF